MTGSVDCVSSEGTGDSVPLVHLRQVVAYRIKTERMKAGLNQQELCDRLRPLGLDWTPATLSAAEAGWNGKTGRMRHFDVVELAALALGLGTTIPRLLEPPSIYPSKQPVPADVAWITIGNAIEADDGGATPVTLTSTKLRALSSSMGLDRHHDFTGPWGVADIKTSSRAVVEDKAPDQAVEQLMQAHGAIQWLLTHLVGGGDQQQEGEETD